MAAPEQAVPTPDVLPSGVRRRLGRRDAVLAAVLLGELLAGVGARAAWNARGTLAALGQPAPVAVAHLTSQATPDTGPLVLPPATTPPSPVALPLRTVPRNPFAAQLP